MTITDPKQRLVTMREAAGLLGMDSGTLLKWIKAGIFRPAVYSRGPVGPGKGSKLDFPDLVTAATIGSILGSGLRHEHLQLTRDATIRVCVRAPAIPPENYIETIDSLEGRRIQQYLERLNYGAVVVVDFQCDVIRGVDIERDIVIWIAPERYASHDPRDTPGRRLALLSEKVTLIYCRFWADILEARLRQLL